MTVGELVHLLAEVPQTATVVASGGLVVTVGDAAPYDLLKAFVLDAALGYDSLTGVVAELDTGACDRVLGTVGATVYGAAAKRMGVYDALDVLYP